MSQYDEDRTIEMKCLILAGATLGLVCIVFIDAYCLVDYLANTKYHDLFLVLVLVLTTAACVAFSLIVMLAKEDYI